MSVEQALVTLPGEPVALSDAGFDISDDVYAGIVRP